MIKVSPQAFQVPRGGRAGHEDDGYSAPLDEGYGAPVDEGYGSPADDGYGTPVDDGYGTPADEGYGSPSDESYGAPEPPPASYGGEPIAILKLTGLDDPAGPVEGFNYMYATENK